MSQVSSLGVLGNYFMRWPEENEKGFIREHEGQLCVCIPSLLFTKEAEPLYEIVAVCKHRRVAEAALRSLRPAALKGGQDAVSDT